MTQIFDRTRKKVFTEKVYGAFWVDFFYSKYSLPFLHWRWVQLFVSKLIGLWNSTPLSVFQINKFCRTFNVDISRFLRPRTGYLSFNQFFIRGYRKEFLDFPNEQKLLGSPCEARLSVFPIQNMMSRLYVKGEMLSLRSLLQSDRIEEHFEGGTALVFRLCPADYHRFHFPDSGIIKKVTRVSGNFFSVNPKALSKFPDIFLKNERVITEFQSENFGKIYYIEVGALCVGKIVQSYKKANKISRGDEKGYFEFGASTVILLLQEQITIANDLIDNTKKGMESFVRVGEVVAKSSGAPLL